VNIRLASPGDISFMMDLERASSSAAHWTEEQYRQAVQSTGSAKRLVLVTEESSAKAISRILGFLVALHVASEWELENIVVAATERRRGLGKRLLEALLARARETKSESVFLEVRESNSAARGLYEKAGFQQMGRRTAYYSNPPEDAVLYRLDLIASI
jgi:[ribosomal protein S18]-alanine N-acetyltransferase